MIETWKVIDRENRERLARLQQTLPQLQRGIDELSQRLAILECEPERIVLAEWDEAFPPIRLNEDTELAGINV